MILLVTENQQTRKCHCIPTIIQFLLFKPSLGLCIERMVNFLFCLSNEILCIDSLPLLPFLWLQSYLRSYLFSFSFWHFLPIIFSFVFQFPFLPSCLIIQLFHNLLDRWYYRFNLIDSTGQYTRSTPSNISQFEE